MYAYCVFCRTERCSTVASLLEIRTKYRCFSPKIIQRKWVKGVPTEVQHDYLPGYIFLYADEPLQERPKEDGILRWLGNGVLQGADLDFAMMLLKKNGVIGAVKVVEEGSLVKLADPAWEGMQGQVIKVDRGKKRCCVSFNFDGNQRTVWVGYDLARALDEEK